MTLFPPLNRVWEEPDVPISARLTEVLSAWEGTPYHASTCIQGRGVSCVGFLASVLDELTGRESGTFPELPRDAAMTRKALRFFLRSYPLDRLHGPALQPGDILAVGTRGPSHAMMIGPRRNTVWQAGGPGVHYTGWVLPPGMRLFASFRPANRETWI